MKIDEMNKIIEMATKFVGLWEERPTIGDGNIKFLVRTKLLGDKDFVAAVYMYDSYISVYIGQDYECMAFKNYENETIYSLFDVAKTYCDNQLVSNGFILPD